VTCRDFADFLLEHAEGGLSPDARREFERHMALCPDCVRYLQHYTETVKAGRLAMADELPADMPESLVNAILRARER
jgi:anti-sigma factor RsiW